MEDRVIALLEEVAGVPRDAIQPAHHLVADLGMDSVAAVQFLALVGEELGIELDLDVVVEVHTVADALALARQVPHDR